MSNEIIKKKYTAKVTGWNTTAYGSIERYIQVDSEEEAHKWCKENSFMGGYEWGVDYITENKK